jgi:transposase
VPLIRCTISLRVDQLAIELCGLAPALVVLEATGGFELTVAATMAAADLPLAVFNPRQIRDFARATGRLAKTDTLDAEIIALFAERIRPEPRAVAEVEAQVWPNWSPGAGNWSR